MKQAIKFVLIILTISITSVFSQSDSTRSLNYRDGFKEIISEKNLIKAEENLRDSIKINPDPELIFQLAKICVSKNTIGSRAEARELLSKAIFKAPKNLKYRFLLAELLWRISSGLAYGVYKDILDIDSTSSEALYNLGLIEAAEFDNDNKSEFRNGLKYSSGIESFVNEDFKRAENHLTKAIKYDHLNKKAYFQLAQLYEDNNEPEKGLNTLQSFAKIYPSDTDVHLFLGLLYFETLQLEKSYKEYTRAFALMPDSLQLEFTFNSAKELTRPQYGNLIDSLASDEVKEIISTYWIEKNPLYISNYNEAFLEHCSRVVYANIHYSLRENGIPDGKILIPGWNSDKGKMVLNEGISPDQDQASATKFEGPLLDVPFEIVQFRNDDYNYTDIYVNYAIDDSTFLDNNIIYNNRYDWGLFFFDTAFNPVIEKMGTVEQIDENRNVDIVGGKNFLFNSLKMSIYPEPGNMAFEIERRKDKGVSSNHFEFNPIAFNLIDPDISDIILTSQLKINAINALPLTRGNISMLPNPLNTFSIKKAVYLYYELYNLGQDPNGFTNFEQILDIKKINQNSDKGYTIASVYKTHKKNPQIYYQLNINNITLGDYVLTIIIKDKITGKEIRNDVSLRLQ
ncbi:MAG: GWxTD domain-containing protein [Ignavibacteriaceae bacterium]